jgi:hypothetical protein
VLNRNEEYDSIAMVENLYRAALVMSTTGALSIKKQEILTDNLFKEKKINENLVSQII